MILERKYDLDVIPGGEPLIIRASKNDSSSRLILSLLAGSGALDPGSSPRFYIRGRVLEKEVRCTYRYAIHSPYRVVVNLTKEMTARAGKKPFEIIIKQTDNNITYNLVTATFYLDIR